jgi:hypothetical protein
MEKISSAKKKCESGSTSNKTSRKRKMFLAATSAENNKA